MSKTIKTLLELPEGLNKRVKIYGAKNDLNITDAIIKVLSDNLEEG
jgi:hypothetical protein